MAVANGLTLGNAACGFAGVLALALQGPAAVPLAAGLVFAGWLFDTVDGMAARAFGVTGRFGAALDSLCDVVSFGVLPALLAVETAGAPLRAAAVAAAALYLACALLRLARYTVKAAGEPAGGERLWFQGMPSTAAAMTVAALALAAPGWPAAAAAVIAGPLMASSAPYPDLTRLYLSRRLPAWTLLPPLALLAAARSAWAVAALFGLYLVASPLLRTRRP